MTEESGSTGGDTGEPVHRDQYGRWLAGQSGNSAGRPVVLQHVRELARQYTALAVGVLASVAADGRAAPASRVAAARELLDREHGRAGPPLERPDRLEEWSDEELAASLEEDVAVAAAAALVGIERAEPADSYESADGEEPG